MATGRKGAQVRDGVTCPGGLDIVIVDPYRWQADILPLRLTEPIVARERQTKILPVSGRATRNISYDQGRYGLQRDRRIAAVSYRDTGPKHGDLGIYGEVICHSEAGIGVSRDHIQVLGPFFALMLFMSNIA